MNITHCNFFLWLWILCISKAFGSTVLSGLISKSECQALTFPSVFKYGYCFFLTGKTGDCVKRGDGQNKVQCSAIHSGAELMVLPDDSMLPTVPAVLEPLECGSYPWVEVSLRQDTSPAGVYDDWNWILPDGSKLGPMTSGWMSSNWAPSGDTPNTAQPRMSWSDTNGGFGDLNAGGTYLGYCMARAVKLDFSSISGKEGTSQIIGTDQDVTSVSKCILKCHNTWHCVAFTYITSSPTNKCRLHWASQSDSRHTSAATANAQFWYVDMP